MQRRRRILIGVGIFAALFLLLFLYAEFAAPRTVGELAEMYKQKCIREKGDGHWQGSSGVTLENFCEASADYQALMEDKKEHPENY